eukprot:SAG22_NODE_15457_length_348_cov_1.024096_1_plen_36_part_10
MHVVCALRHPRVCLVPQPPQTAPFLAAPTTLRGSGV